MYYSISKKVGGKKLTVTASNVGYSRTIFSKTLDHFLKHKSIKKFLKGAQYQVISFQNLEEDDKIRQKKSKNNCRAFIYDYTNNRTIIANGIVNKGPTEVFESGIQPIPNDEEFENAVKILQKDRRWSSAIKNKLLQPYRPMPPLISMPKLDGCEERILTVGLLPKSRKNKHEIVGVNMNQQKAIRFAKGYPPKTLALKKVCDPPPSAGQATTSQGVPGMVRVTVTSGNTELWRFYAVRPSSSSGYYGSGIELRHVYYKGRKVLWRAHVPILNVEYENNLCGPYRDWQYQEGMIEANGTDVGSTGFRLCPSPARTILDTGSDVGNFLGVAVYISGQEIVLVSEMHAGWYRYVSEWRLNVNGTIKPRFGFDAVSSSCTCNTHHHHAYWRFDFDIDGAGNNYVREHNKIFWWPIGWTTIKFERKRYRRSFVKRKWMIKNANTKRGYRIIPGKNDGRADDFARGDVWILRYRGSEIDDGHTGGTYFNPEADLDKYVNGESVYKQDVVFWYAGHFLHDENTSEEVSHIVGPDLRPVNW